MLLRLKTRILGGQSCGDVAKPIFPVSTIHKRLQSSIYNHKKCVSHQFSRLLNISWEKFMITNWKIYWQRCGTLKPSGFRSFGLGLRAKSSQGKVQQDLNRRLPFLTTSCRELSEFLLGSAEKLRKLVNRSQILCLERLGRNFDSNFDWASEKLEKVRKRFKKQN